MWLSYERLDWRKNFANTICWYIYVFQKRGWKTRKRYLGDFPCSSIRESRAICYCWRYVCACIHVFYFLFLILFYLFFFKFIYLFIFIHDMSWPFILICCESIMYLFLSHPVFLFISPSPPLHFLPLLSLLPPLSLFSPTPSPPSTFLPSLTPSPPSPSSLSSLSPGDLETSKKMQDEMINAAEEFYQSLGVCVCVWVFVCESVCVLLLLLLLPVTQCVSAWVCMCVIVCVRECVLFLLCVRYCCDCY